MSKSASHETVSASWYQECLLIRTELENAREFMIFFSNLVIHSDSLASYLSLRPAIYKYRHVKNRLDKPFIFRLIVTPLPFRHLLHCQSTIWSSTWFYWLCFWSWYKQFSVNQHSRRVFRIIIILNGEWKRREKRPPRSTGKFRFIYCHSVFPLDDMVAFHCSSCLDLPFLFKFNLLC